MKQEYPKMVFLDGDKTKGIVVSNDEEHKTANAKGFYRLARKKEIVADVVEEVIEEKTDKPKRKRRSPEEMEAFRKKEAARKGK